MGSGATRPVELAASVPSKAEIGPTSIDFSPPFYVTDAYHQAPTMNRSLSESAVEGRNSILDASSVAAVVPTNVTPMSALGREIQMHEVGIERPCMSMEVGRESEASGNEMAEMFAATAMSLGMEGDDLLFNMLYFSEMEGDAHIGNMVNNMMEETVALHSANNTPYKLAPISSDQLSELKSEIVGPGNNHIEQDECSVCQEKINIGEEVTMLPSCAHYFHSVCIRKWFTLQNWCPFCRIKFDVTPSSKLKSSLDSSDVSQRKSRDSQLLSESYADEIAGEAMTYSSEDEANERLTKVYSECCRSEKAGPKDADFSEYEEKKRVTRSKDKIFPSDSKKISAFPPNEVGDLLTSDNTRNSSFQSEQVDKKWMTSADGK